MQPTSTSTPTTTTTSSTTTSPTTTDAPDEQSGLEEVGDIVSDPVGSITGAPFKLLDQAASDMSGSAFGRLAEVGVVAGEPDEVVIGSLGVTVHMLAAFVAFATIATTLLFLAVSPRRKLGSRVYYLGASTTKFLLISSLGVTIGVALVELSNKLTTEAIEVTLPDEINTDGANIYDAALAVVAVPMVEVAFSFQTFFVGVLIAFWPLAAAVSILRSFKHALPIFTTLLIANVAWPPLAALAIGKSFDVLPSVGAASWWCVAAVLTAPLTNFIALAARSTS